MCLFMFCSCLMVQIFMLRVSVFVSWSNQSLLCLAASYGTYPICKGCSVCSKDNGCMNCQPKLFLFLRRERMRQYGECLHSCPSGFYGMRGTEINMCSSKHLPIPTYTQNTSMCKHICGTGVWML